MALAMGSIMAVEAVLLSHMDRKAVLTIIPKMSLEVEGVRGRAGTGVQEVLWPDFAMRRHPAPSFYRWPPLYNKVALV